MKVFLLAGGLGTRLRPRFGDLPKPLAPLAGRPFLERQIAWLAGHGFRDFVICAGYGADAMQSALGSGERLGVRLAWSVEAEPLGTGGALKLASEHVDGAALVVNGDTLCECDPWVLERERWQRAALGSVALFGVEQAAGRGRVECRDDGVITRFVEKDPGWKGPAWVNGGLYAFSHALWKRLPAGVSSLERDVLEPAAASGELAGLRSPGAFWDIGTPEDWARAEAHFGADAAGGKTA
jgi:NDP-sugar pyrophosphorylase family protein